MKKFFNFMFVFMLILPCFFFASCNTNSGDTSKDVTDEEVYTILYDVANAKIANNYLGLSIETNSSQMVNLTADPTNLSASSVALINQKLKTVANNMSSSGKTNFGLASAGNEGYEYYSTFNPATNKTEFSMGEFAFKESNKYINNVSNGTSFNKFYVDENYASNSFGKSNETNLSFISTISEQSSFEEFKSAIPEIVLDTIPMTFDETKSTLNCFFNRGINSYTLKCKFSSTNAKTSLFADSTDSDISVVANLELYYSNQNIVSAKLVADLSGTVTMLSDSDSTINANLNASLVKNVKFANFSNSIFQDSIQSKFKGTGANNEILNRPSTIHYMIDNCEYTTETFTFGTKNISIKGLDFVDGATLSSWCWDKNMSKPATISTMPSYDLYLYSKATPKTNYAKVITKFIDANTGIQTHQSLEILPAGSEYTVKKSTVTVNGASRRTIKTLFNGRDITTSTNADIISLASKTSYEIAYYYI